MNDKEKKFKSAWDKLEQELTTAGLADKKMIEPASWEAFRSTGLVLFINFFLHVFGWSLVIELDTKTEKILSVFPARTRFKGFSDEKICEAFFKIDKHLRDVFNERKEDDKTRTPWDDRKK